MTSLSLPALPEISCIYTWTLLDSLGLGLRHVELKGELRDGLQKLSQLCLPCTKVQTFLQKPEEKPKVNRAETPKRNNLKQPSKCTTFSTPSPLHSHTHPQKLLKALRFAESQAPLAPLPKPSQEPAPLLGQCAVLLSSCFTYV